MNRVGTLSLVVLAGCGLPQVDPDFRGLPADADPKTFTCCHDPERWPEEIVQFSLSIAPWALELNPLDTDVIPGLLTGKSDAHQHIVDRLRPLDIVLMANKTNIGGRFVPGRFTHSAVYLGTEAELRQIGLWDTPAFRPLQGQIRDGLVFIEAFRPVVRLSTAEKLFETDAVALIRPDLGLAARKRSALTLVSKLGVPFDYWFDNSTPDALSCTEMIGIAMPELDFTLRTSYGRPAAMPDDVVAQAIRGERMQFLEQVRGLPEGGFIVEGPRGAMRDILAFWGPDPTKETGR